MVVVVAVVVVAVVIAVVSVCICTYFHAHSIAQNASKRGFIAKDRECYIVED